MPVQSLLETYHYGRECHIRTDGLKSGKLEPLFCELQLTTVTVAENIKIEEGLLAKAMYCRQEAAKFMYGEEPTAQHIATMYKERINHSLTSDKFARLEMKLFEASAGQGGTERVHALIISFLPTAEVHRKPLTVLQKFNDHSQDKLLTSAGTGAITLYNNCKSFCKAICEGSSPFVPRGYRDSILQGHQRPVAFLC